MLKKLSIMGVAGVLAVSALAGCASDKKDEVVEEDVVVTEEVQSEGVDEEAQSGEPVAYVVDNDLVGYYELVDLNVAGTDNAIDSYELLEPVVLTITEDGHINGKVCNVFNSFVTEDGETGIATSTMMYCEDPENIMEVENLVLGTFEGTVNPDDNGVVFIGTNGDQSVWELVEVEDVETVTTDDE